MAHSNNIISSIKLPNGTTYEIHDPQAIHSLEDLGLDVLVFKGVLDSTDDLYALTDFKTGDVYIVGDAEYVAVKDYNASSSDAQESFWEKLGGIIDAASSTHKHAVTVTGTNEASTVTASVNIPTVDAQTKYLTATAKQGTVDVNSANVLSADTTFTANASLTKATIKNPSVSSVTASKVTASAVTIPNVTGNTAVTASKLSNAGSKTNGTAASWSASVSNGVLSFGWTANTPTAVTLPTFTDVTATNTTLGTELSASKVTATDVTASKVTTTDVNVATDVTIDVTRSEGDVAVLTDVTVGAPTVTLADSATSGIAISRVTVGNTSASVTGTAAAQKWTQSTGTTGTPQ